MTTRKKSTARPAHRPPLPAGTARVVLPAQRVAPETLAKLRALAPAHGGVGRVLDAWAK